MLIPKACHSHAEMELIHKQEAEQKKITMEENQQALKCVTEIEDTLQCEDIAHNAKLHSSAAMAREDSDAVKRSRPKVARGGCKDLQVADNPEIEEDCKLYIIIKHFFSLPITMKWKPMCNSVIMIWTPS